MTDNVTARELLDTIQSIKPNVEAMTERYKSAALELVGAEEVLKMAEANAFLQAKEQGATNQEAEKIATIATSEKRERVHRLKEEKAAARLGSDAWQKFLEAIEATGHAYNRELRLEQTGSRWET